MPHLTVEEIINFVSFDRITEETLDLSAKVNGHIRLCPDCCKKVSSFQMVYDELCKIGNVTDVKQSIYRLVEKGMPETINLSELSEEDLLKLI